MISMTLSLSPCSEKMSVIGEETKLRKEEKLISESREIYSAIAKQFKMKSTAIKVTMEKINFFTCSTLVVKTPSFMNVVFLFIVQALIEFS